MSDADSGEGPDALLFSTRFVSEGAQTELTIQPPVEGFRFVGAAHAFEDLQALPLRLEFQDVSARAGTYKKFLRSFGVPPEDQHLNSAYDRLQRLFGQASNRPFEWRIAAISRDSAIPNLATLPWELVLFDESDVSLLGRAAVVRTLDRSSDYTPSQVADPLRTLVVQGGQTGGGKLQFDREATNFERAWQDLGLASRARIAEPIVTGSSLELLGPTIQKVKPHVLCFSGHGRATPAGFEFLFEGDNAWTPVEKIASVLVDARDVAGLPMLVAFWTCESLMVVEEAMTDLALQGALPAIVAAMSDIGIEAVIGCQTRVQDSCSRILARALFRAIAEGQGPSRALALARAELARGSESTPPGAEAEWPSPVLWIGGAAMPRLIWARPEEEERALLLERVSYESLNASDAATGLASEAGAGVGRVEGWFGNTPCWVVHENVAHDSIGLRRMLGRAALPDGTSLLVLNVQPDDADNFLRAFAGNMREIKARIFPGAGYTNTAWLMSILALAEREDRREDAWQQLLQRPNLAIAVIAKGGISDIAALLQAINAKKPVVVIAPSGPSGARGSSWYVDTFSAETKADVPPTLQPFLQALAVFGRALSRRQVNEFGTLLGTEEAFVAAEAFLLNYGGRYALGALLGAQLAASLTPDCARTAHEQCLRFLDGVASSAAWPPELIARWRLEHAIAAELADDNIISRAGTAIEAWVKAGDAHQVAEIYKLLGRRRRDIPFERLLQVATAYRGMGHSDRAATLLSQIPSGQLDDYQKVELALAYAEALRNLPDRSMQAEALTLLQEALKIAERLVQTEMGGDYEVLLRMTVEHDIARHSVYFQKDSRSAKKAYQEIIEGCDEVPDRQRLKVAALRNLADVCDRYAYGLPTDPAGAVKYLSEAQRIIDQTLTEPALLPHISYELSKALDRANRADEAKSCLASSIIRARGEGDALVLALASNRRFWKEHAASEHFLDSQLGNWFNTEMLLEAVDNHSWARRALVTSRIRAARRIAEDDPKKSRELLLGAASALLGSDGLTSASDMVDRWLPVYAGLSRRSGDQQARQKAGQLAARLDEAGIDRNDIGAIWKRVS
ncbi:MULTISPECIES: CHAT domain-containing protein [Mesorhizobium]|uniref:CHAT domain-containing protein n=1 Tax=Mesorhizobium TaxID=68287 RepID=UPI0007EC9D50|nr:MULTISPECIES: CHAT domain-containing protein [Mesorhizobium]PBB52967.1 CHAT domain-containing protein [Mesorhizobium loti]QIA22499.1 CHAT domain-containing protein [Mesorhizobium sp. AA22]